MPTVVVYFAEGDRNLLDLYGLFFPTNGKQGWQTGFFASPEELLDGIRQQAPDVVVIDDYQFCPDMDIPSLWWLKREYHNLKIVVTSFSHREKEVKLAGADQFIHKPLYDLQELEDAILRSLRSQPA